MSNGSITPLRSSWYDLREQTFRGKISNGFFGTLDVCAGVTHEPQLTIYCPSLCVAPSAVFPDYDCVIARLKAEREGVPNEEGGEEVTQEICRSEQLQGTNAIIEDLGPSFDSPNSDDDGDDADDQEKFDDKDEEYREPEKTLVHNAALDISNTYASRIRKTAPTRKSRRHKPYECRRSGTSSEDEVSVSARCPYVSPEDGTRCRKINKTPQEGGRHWRSCHLYKEAKEMLTGVLPVGKGTAITSEAKLAEVTPHIQCPLCCALITRSDAMRRHLRTNCKALEDGVADEDHRKKGGCRPLAR